MLKGIPGFHSFSLPTPLIFRRFASCFIITIALVIVAFSLFGIATVESATIQTDRQDYFPGETVVITGSGWQPGETVSMLLEESPDYCPDRTLSAVADASGNIYNNSFYPEEHDIGVTFYLTATGLSSGLQAQTVFSDSSIHFTQCLNDSENNNLIDDCDWSTGAINQNNSIYTEGDSVPQRLLLKIDTAATHTVRLEYDFSKASIYAYDFVTNADDTQSGALLNECANLPLFISATDCASLFSGPDADTVNAAIPSDPFDSVASKETPASRSIRVGCSPACSGTAIVTFPSLDGGDDPGEAHNPDTDPDCNQTCGTSSVFIEITFTTTAVDSLVGIWFGGHLAVSFDPNPLGLPDGWGSGFGASSISGAPFHISYKSLDGDSTGQRDNQLQPGAVVPPGTIIVKKVTIPSGAPGSFTFTGDAAGTISDGQSITVFGLKPGQYTSTENDPTSAGFDLSSVSCNDTNSTGNVGTRTATFNLEAGETVTCTFTNVQRGHILVDKVTDPSGDSTSFEFDPSYSSTNFFLTDGATPDDSGTLTPGTYSVAEVNIPAGWDLTGTTCSDGSPVSAIDLSAGETVTCTFTNTKRGHIIVDKVTNPSGDPQSFNFDAGGGSYADFSLTDAAAPNDQTLVPGTYSVSETVPSGWSQTSATCSDGSLISAIELGAGETITCTFTNTKRGHIIVDKITNPSGDPQSFDFDAGGGTYADFSLTDAATPNDQTLVPGTYSVSETVPSGWDQTSASCSDGSPINAIVLSAGETITCTFTNTKRGHIIVDKVTNPSGDPQSFNFDAGGGSYADFSLTDAAAPNDQILVPGTYSVSETVPGGWDQTGASCSDGSPVNAIVLSAGETVTCTFTNTKRGHIIVDKVTDPSGDPQSFNFDAGGGTYADFSLTDAATPNDQTLVPGTYSVSETVPSGWDQTDASCSDGSPVSAIDLSAGETITCTFKNTKRGHIIVDKITYPSGDPQSFDFDAGGGNYADFSLTDAATPNNQELVPGTYSVSEGAVAGWDLTSATCSDGSPVSAIDLSAGETITCTFKNTKRGHIIVDKITYPSGDPQSFNFDAGGGSYADFSLTDAATPNNQELVPGTYSVSEGAVAGWDLTSATCSDGSPVSAIVLSAGETVTCTFKNTKRGTIVVEKQTDPDGASGSFGFTGTAAGTISDGGTIVVSNLVPGQYTSTENDPTPNFDLYAITCSDINSSGNVSTRTATFNLEAGETVTCTFTNRQRGMAKVVKTVSGAAPSGTDSFTFQLRSGASSTQAGSILETGTADAANLGAINFSTKLVPGTTYALCELVMPGWMTTLGPPFYVVYNPSGDNSVVCTDFTVSAGETKTFSINNTPPPGGLARTIGFWKNWASCSGSNGNQEPVLDETLAASEPAGISIGDLVLHTGDCVSAVKILDKRQTCSPYKKMSSDPAWNLAAQLLAAKLNVVAGAGVCPAAVTAINDAQALLDLVNFNGCKHDNMTTAQKNQANALAATLDAYNNNTLCQ